ncbi:MAG: metallophosphoesterase [Ignavibacteria bacterium]|nr:metallophosphoesterase [Ignavibacteria bacterium]MBT8381030.1 metallophosphoesterase [Ignavibacteria bacterium]MBT8393033.1 metallophosphoesterase [Ignavibacteria bacterium]NNJ52020.1 metallophosphoesterase [Ignavibacteriaceae bacterium]NNL20496.1 metallophosphoesterase [Ignavibacteriaceae bacterium]
MILFFTIFFAVYTALNYYIFIRGWQTLQTLPALKPFYIAAFVIVVYGYVFAKLLYKFLPPIVYDIWLGVGAVWFAFLVYFILVLLGMDILRLLDSFFHFLPKSIYNNYEQTKKIAAIVIIALVGIIVFLGNLNKRDITITSINVTLPKSDGKISDLNVVMAADLHLSPIDGEKLLSKIVDKINSVDPDIILFAGDIVDDKAEILKPRGIGESFKQLKPKYGVYAVNGNHEFINDVETSVKFMEEYGMKVIRDSYELVDSSFYIVGREDVVMDRFTGKKRKTLNTIISTINSSHPKILLDHTPVKLEHAEQNKIDLQFSGHTHHGQIWPGNIITNMIYELSWGYKKKGNTQYYVTSGAGTWGPPVRTGSKSEIVNIKITFK